MTYNTGEARRELLEQLAQATEEIGFALASLGEAYEQLDDYAAEKLEAGIFRPVQSAYAQAKRTHADFAKRYALSSRELQPRAVGPLSAGAKGFLSSAVEAIANADGGLSSLQDSMLPVEVGDAELRAGITRVRELLGSLQARARELTRTLGR